MPAIPGMEKFRGMYEKMSKNLITIILQDTIVYVGMCALRGIRLAITATYNRSINAPTEIFPSN